MAADKNKVTKRSDVNRPLKFEEGDQNLQEIKNVIDDQQGFESTQETVNSNLQTQVGTAQNDIDNHKSAADPHTQYYKDGDAIDDGVVTTGSGEQTVRAALNQRVIYVDTLADLQALPTGGLVDGQGLKITTTGRAGDFVVKVGDFSTEVTNDPESGVWVPFDSDPTGGSVVAMRTNEELYLDFWGLGETSDDSVAIIAAIRYAASKGGLEILNKAPSITVNTPIETTEAHGVSLRTVIPCLITNDSLDSNKRISAIFETGNLYQQDVTDLDYKPISGNISEGKSDVVMLNSADADSLSIGDPVFIHGGNFYESGTFRFYENGMFTYIKSKSGTTITLAHPTPYTSTTNNELALWDSSIVSAVYGGNLKYTQDFKLLGPWSAISESRGYLFTGGGCIDCEWELENIDADAYIFANSWTSSKATLSGKARVDRTLYEMALNSVYNEIYFKDGELLTAGVAGKRVIRTSENGSKNTLHFDTADLDAWTASDVPVYLDASRDTRISGRVLTARNAPLRLVTFSNQATSPSVMPLHRMLFDVETLVGGSSDRYVDMIDNGNQEDCHFSARNVYGTLSTGTAVRLAGLRPKVTNSIFAQGGVSVDAGAVDEIVDNTFAPDGILDVARAQTTGRYNVQSSGIRNARAENFTEGFFEVTSTSLANIHQATYPSGSLDSGYIIHISGAFVASGTAGEKEFKLSFAGVEIATLLLAAGDTGPVGFDGYVHITSITAMAHKVSVSFGGTVTEFIDGNSISDVTANPTNLTLQGRLASGSDTFRLRTYITRVKAPGYW